MIAVRYIKNNRSARTYPHYAYNPITRFGIDSKIIDTLSSHSYY